MGVQISKRISLLNYPNNFSITRKTFERLEKYFEVVILSNVKNQSWRLWNPIGSQNPETFDKYGGICCSNHYRCHRLFKKSNICHCSKILSCTWFNSISMQSATNWYSNKFKSANSRDWFEKYWGEF